MKKCLLWGASSDYLKRKNQLEFEILKNNIEVVAICSRDKFVAEINGLKVISKQQIKEYSVDYIIVFQDKRYEMIKNEAVELGYASNRIINSTILDFPNFDFGRYTTLLENPITIICKDCWGATLYSYLQLQFTSPFILFSISKTEDYLTLLEDFDYYINAPFEMEREGDIPKQIWPIASVGRGDKKINIDCYHYPDFRSAKNAWEKRKKRINVDNYFVCVEVKNEEQILRFKQLPFKNKVAFCSERLEEPEVVYLPRYIWRTQHQPDKYGYSFNAYLRDMEQLSFGVDILKMLNGEKDFVLEK